MGFANVAGVLNSNGLLGQTQLVANPVGLRSGRNETDG
jgi:hypothetical protein